MSVTGLKPAIRSFSSVIDASHAYGVAPLAS